jgi:predicted O-methyltransferase YrrM
MLDPSFLEAVKALLSPWTGTALMAPLLYTLARFTRARTVLEGGSGYTTPFLAKALADNAHAVEEERRAMQAKTARYVADLDAMQVTPAPVEPGTKAASGLLALYSPSSPVAKRRLAWLGENPGFARPAGLERSYKPRLISVDNLSSPRTSAPKAQSIIESLGFSDFVTFHHGDFWSYDLDNIAAEHLPIDLMWVDLHTRLKDAYSLVDGPHWSRLNANGGLLVIHDLLTTRGGQMLDEMFRQRQRQRSDLQIVGLLEPDRIMQGDFVLIRRTSAAVQTVDDFVNATGESVLEGEARAFLKSEQTKLPRI